jgi:oligopeptide/dipeptide ABC transporter ATP-binding protein
MATTAENGFKIGHLNVSYMSRGVRVNALKDFSLSMKENESVGLLGESGAGKSTVGWAVLGMIEEPNIVTGSIGFGGENVLSMSKRELNEYRWKDAAMIFQGSLNTLDPLTTVGRNMVELLMHKRFCKTKEEAQELSLKTLQVLGLGESTMDAYPHQLSGGMRQRVAIAMAISTDPSMLIADEPTTALDTITQASILRLISKLRDEKRIRNVLFISHDVTVHAFLADRVIVMFRGRSVEEGSTKEVIKNPLHPYTKLLMSSIRIDSPKEAVIAPLVDEESSELGCPYRNYCPHAMAVCADSFPEVTTVTEGHTVACFLYGGK